MTTRKEREARIMRRVHIEFEGQVCKCGHQAVSHDIVDFQIGRRNPLLGHCSTYLESAGKECPCILFVRV